MPIARINERIRVPQVRVIGEEGEQLGVLDIRDAQMQKVPFMLVLGDREMEQGNVAVRERSQGDIGVMSTSDFVEMARRLIKQRALTNT